MRRMGRVTDDEVMAGFSFESLMPSLDTPVACGAEAQSANKHKIIFLKHKMKLGTIAALSMAVASEVTMFIYLAPAVLSL